MSSDAGITRCLLVRQVDGFLQDPKFQPTWASVGIAPNQSGHEVVSNLLDGGRLDSVYFHPDRFEAVVDAREYKPENIEVSTTSSKVMITAKNEVEVSQSETKKRRIITMTRTYELPQMVAAEKGSCLLSSDGILVIQTPWKQTYPRG